MLRGGREGKHLKQVLYKKKYIYIFKKWDVARMRWRKESWNKFNTHMVRMNYFSSCFINRTRTYMYTKWV
jgi:hypothetical protein